MDEQEEQGRWILRGYNLFEISSSFVGSTELLFHSCLSPLLVFAFLPFLSLPLFFHFIYLLLSSLFITPALNSLLSVLFLVLCLSSLPMSALVCFFDLASRLFWSKSHITSKHSVIFLLIQLRNTYCSWFQTKFHQKYMFCPGELSPSIAFLRQSWQTTEKKSKGFNIYNNTCKGMCFH